MDIKKVDRRQMLSYAAFSSATLGAAAPSWAGAASSAATLTETANENARAPRVYSMKKSINLWAFPYPDRMNLEECLKLAKRAGFDGIELNYDLDSELSPQSGTSDFSRIRAMAEKIGIAISGLCSFLFWPYPLTSNNPAERARGLELADLMIHAAHDLGTENLLVVPGAVHMPWRADHEPTPNDLCDQRAKAAVSKLLPKAEQLGVYLNIENIFFNGYLMSPMEMVGFVDSFDSPYVRVHFDTGNIMLFQFPEHWIPILGQRIKNTHLKEFSKKGTDFSLESFRPLLDGTTNWPAVIDALEGIGFDGYLTFEYFHPYVHYPEALIYQTSDSLDLLLGRGSV